VLGLRVNRAARLARRTETAGEENFGDKNRSWQNRLDQETTASQQNLRAGQLRSDKSRCRNETEAAAEPEPEPRERSGHEIERTNQNT
jgi:hypothetical protein